MTRRLRIVLVAASVAWASQPRKGSPQVVAGPEFQVNTFTTWGQSRSSVASDSSGNFVVAWEGGAQIDPQYPGMLDRGPFVRRYLASGTALGPEFQVNSNTASDAPGGTVASDPNGNLVVAWDGIDGYGWGTVARRLDATGAALGTEFVVNTYTTTDQFGPHVAMDAAGNFVVAWTSFGVPSQDGSYGGGVYAQRYDNAGVRRGGEFQVNSYTTSNQYVQSVAMDATGRFVIVWQGFRQDGSNYGVFGRLYDALGVPGDEFQVNVYTTGIQNNPSVAMDAGGGFLVVWSFGSARRYDPLGVAEGQEFQIATTTDIQYPRVTFGEDGGFVVVWTGSNDGYGQGVFGRTFNAGGVPEGEVFQVNSYTTERQNHPAVTSQPGGRFVVSWSSLAQDGNSYGIFGRRFARDPIFKDDFESGHLSRWSLTATGGGKLSTSSSASMNSTTTGLAGVVDGAASLYVQDDRPLDEDRYRVRFYFNPHGFDPGEAESHFRARIFVVFEENPTRRLAAIVVKRKGNAYSLMARCRLDDGSHADTAFFPIDDGPHSIEVDWTRSTGLAANDGRFELWIDGTSVAAETGLANSISSVDFVRMGALNVKSGASGTLFWDEFESHRITYVGP